MNDRYRGVHGRRDIVFVHHDDLTRLGLADGDKVDVVAMNNRVLSNVTAVAYPIAKGSVATYFPEANVLVAAQDFDHECGIPAYKSIPITLREAINPERGV